MSHGTAVLLTRAAFSLLAISVIFRSRGVFGQQLELSIYANMPVGMNFAIAGYGYVTGNAVPNISLFAEDMDKTSWGPGMVIVELIPGARMVPHGTDRRTMPAGHPDPQDPEVQRMIKTTEKTTMSSSAPATQAKRSIHQTAKAAIRIGLKFQLAAWCFLIVEPFIIPILCGMVIAIPSAALYRCTQ